MRIFRIMSRLLARPVLFNLGYPRTSYGVCKNEKKCYLMINAEPDLGLATGDSDVRAFD
jgi:hypothetical protein